MMVIQRRTLALAFTMHAQCSAFSPHNTLRRASAIASTASKDDPTFSNVHDYEHLKHSRPIRIHAKPIPLNDNHLLRKEQLLSPHSKIVHFQRHGQGTHNEIYAQWTASTGTPLNLSETDPAKNPLLLPNVIDAPLTTKGIGQCQEQYKLNANNLRGVERIIVSPLVRALQTAHLTFRDHVPTLTGESNGAITWTAHEGCREELGMLLCNKRRPLSETKLDFPHVDFSQLSHHGEDDHTWDQFAINFATDSGVAQRESMEDMSHRVYDFLADFLRHLPEREVAVVGHSAWLHAMCNAVLDHDIGDDGERLDTGMFGQAEIRTLELTFIEK